MTEEKPLDAHKREKLVLETTALARAYVTAGKTVAEGVAHNLHVHQALAKALDPNGPFTHIIATEIEKQWNTLQPNPEYALPHEEAMRCAKNILINRAREEQQYVALLTSEDFTTKEVKTALEHNLVSHGSHALPEGKIKELQGRLVQEYDPNGPEGVTHNAADAFGQRVMHEALANCYAPNGPLTDALIGLLKPSMAQATPESLQAIANAWLHDRYHPAKAVVEAMKFSGEAYQGAAKRSEEIQAGAPAAKPGFAAREKQKALTGAKEVVMDV